MNIGVDIDHTITEAPELFSAMLNGFLASGHKVFIITYRSNLDRLMTEKELESYNVKYTKLIMTPEDPPLPPGPWKCKIARQIDLDIMIDDAPEVIRDMPKKVKTIWLFDRSIFDIDACILGIKASPKIGII